MRNWHAFVREHAARPLSDQAVEELAQHVEETYAAATAAGRSEADALALARTQLENPPRRLPARMIAPPSSGPAAAVAAIVRDLRYAVRMLAARPGFTAVAVLTLALGIGANTAIFSVVRSLLLEPLPFRDPDRLVMLWEADAENPQRMSIVSMPNYADFSRGVKALENTAIFEYLNFNFSGEGEAERVPGLRVSASAFTVLGVEPELGRTFTPEEDAPGHDVAIISHALWQRRFGGRRDIVGATARINGLAYQIVGVMPPSFIFPAREAGVWTPIAFNEEDQGRNSHSFNAMGRLRPGVTLAAANAEIDTLARALAKQYPESNGGNTAVLTPMRDLGVAQLRPTLFALMGAVAFVLAIACVNVANLLLAQSSSRRQEFAVRAALGASRRRLAAQLLAEALVIATAGGAAGLAVAWASTQLLTGVLPASIVSAPFRDAGRGIHLDPRMLAFTASISILTGMLFGLAPLAGIRRNADLRAGGTRSTTGRMSAIRTTLVATEVALALVVLVAAGLMVKSLMRVFGNDPGLNPSNVLVLTMSLPQPDFYGPPVRKTFCSDVTERVGTLPGVVTAGAISHLPLSGANAGRSFSIEGRTLPPGQNASAAYRLTCPGYFKALGIPLLKGRDFDARDATESPGVVIINEETAKRYWPDDDPVGKRFKLGRPDGSNPWMTVVGVVGNVRHFGLDDVARREMFRPYSQAAWPMMTIVAKTATDPAGFATAVRGALQRIDPDLPVGRTTTMAAIQTNSTGARRFPMILLAAFGGVALALAVVGVYGVVSYVVTQRTREIGIRVALGARRAQVIRLVLLGAMRPVVAGLVVGAAGAVFAARLLGALLYQVKPGDPTVIAGIGALLAAAAVVASLVPGARATRVDPITVLRAE
jgi:putative ABC transport system permease protein